tara:strand:- start:298 stop:1848 length:1551 start_codon:yes stop_codon:yes gene_type:complete
MLGATALLLAAVPPHHPAALAAAPQQPEWADRSSLELCLGLKQNGARFGGLAALKQWMAHRFKEEKVVLVVPSDPYTGAGHDDQRLYARVLLNWTETEQLHISYYVSDPNDSSAPLPQGDPKTNFVMLGSPDVHLSNRLRKHGNGRLLFVSDHTCEQSDALSSKPTNPDMDSSFALGCPAVADDLPRRGRFFGRDLHMYFTPRGAELSKLWPDKAEKPLMLVDASEPWTGISAHEFVDSVVNSVPEMSFVILGDESFKLNITGRFEHYMDPLPRDHVQKLLRNSWFYASGAKRTRGQPLLDAAMAGAVLVDVTNGSTALVRPPTAIRIEHLTEVHRIVKATRDVHALTSKTSTWAKDFHGSEYTALNLLCALHAHSSDERSIFAAKQFALPSEKGGASGGAGVGDAKALALVAVDEPSKALADFITRHGLPVDAVAELHEIFASVKQQANESAWMSCLRDDIHRNVNCSGVALAAADETEQVPGDDAPLVAAQAEVTQACKRGVWKHDKWMCLEFF